MKPKNPPIIPEQEAEQGSRALMMQECIMSTMIERYRTEEQKTCKHVGCVFQGVGCSIFDVTHIPKYLFCDRMIQLGHRQAQVALNFIQ